jgi:chromosome segregation ATPase
MNHNCDCKTTRPFVSEAGDQGRHDEPDELGPDQENAAADPWAQIDHLRGQLDFALELQRELWLQRKAAEERAAALEAKLVKRQWRLDDAREAIRLLQAKVRELGEQLGEEVATANEVMLQFCQACATIQRLHGELSAQRHPARKREAAVAAPNLYPSIFVKP